MPRIVRLLFPSSALRDGDLLASASARREFLASLRNAAREQGLKFLAWAILPQRAHLILTPEYQEPLTRVLVSVGDRCFGKELLPEFPGGWPPGFSSSCIDDWETVDAIRFVEQEPVRLRLCRLAVEYPWSSARGHAGLTPDPLEVLRPPLLEWVDWMDFLVEGKFSSLETLTASAMLAPLSAREL